MTDFGILCKRSNRAAPTHRSCEIGISLVLAILAGETNVVANIAGAKKILICVEIEMTPDGATNAVTGGGSPCKHPDRTTLAIVFTVDTIALIFAIGAKCATGRGGVPGKHPN